MFGGARLEVRTSVHHEDTVFSIRTRNTNNLGSAILPPQRSFTAGLSVSVLLNAQGHKLCKLGGRLLGRKGLAGPAYLLKSFFFAHVEQHDLSIDQLIDGKPLSTISQNRDIRVFECQ